MRLLLIAAALSTFGLIPRGSGESSALDAAAPIDPSDLALSKSVSDPTPNVGDQVTFTVTLTNDGPDPATGVAVTDLLPAGLTFVSATPSQGTYDPGTGVWTVGGARRRRSGDAALVATVVSPAPRTNTATVSAADQFDPEPRQQRRLGNRDPAAGRPGADRSRSTTRRRMSVTR